MLFLTASINVIITPSLNLFRKINEKLRQPSRVEEEKPRVEPKVVKEEVKPKDEPVKKDVPTISLDEEVREDRFFDDFFDDDDE